MLLIACPHCGPRLETEFILGGPARDPRPDDPAALDDEDWVDHLIVPANPLGLVREKWWHVRGCGAWTVLARHTVTHEFVVPERAGG